MKKKSNEYFDREIKNRPLRRIQNYINAKSPIEFQCLICDYIWNARPDDICQGKGCPKCANKLKLSNQIIDEKLSGRKIKRLGNYINNKTHLLFKCLQDNCGYEWNTITTNILNKGCGCPKCAKKAPYTNDLIDAIIQPLNIKRVGDYNGIYYKISFQCLNCNFVWKYAPSNFIHNNAQCPKCSNFSNEKLIYQFLVEHKILFKYQYYLPLLNKYFPKYKVDFYLPQFNTIIEYNGKQHYEPVCFGGCSQEQANKNFEKQAHRDLCLNEICNTNDIHLIMIDGRVFTHDKLIIHISNIINQLNNNVNINNKGE